MDIVKAKVTKDNTLLATYKDETGTITLEGKNLVTNDLLNAFSALIPHVAFLAEQKEADGKESLDELPEDIESILEVTGFSIGGDGESQGVTLIAKRFLKSNKVLNLTTPFTMFASENEQYEFQFELEQAIQQCNFEVNEYIFNKKWKVVEQELPFAEEAADTAVTADAVPEASTEDAQAFQAALAEKSIKITRKKSRKTRTQLAS